MILLSFYLVKSLKLLTANFKTLPPMIFKPLGWLLRWLRLKSWCRVLCNYIASIDIRSFTIIQLFERISLMWKNKTNQLGSTNESVKNKIKGNICFRVKLRGYWTLLIQLIYWLTDSKVVEPRMSTVLVSRGLCLCQGRIDHVMENNGILKNFHKGPKGHNICRILRPNWKSCKNDMV